MPVYTDFSSLLAGATIVSGLIWGIDSLLFKPKRVKAALPNQEVKEPKLVEYARSFFPILLIVCVLRSFVAEPFRIPSGSMKPTLLEGDFILVNKFDYGIRLPVIGKKIIKIDEPKRGDILVFRFPKDPSIDFIKRVIAVPGDTISYVDKTVYLNGEPLKMESMGSVYDTDIDGHTYKMKQFKEQLKGRPHAVFVNEIESASMAQITVPEGMYFVMGDNRDNSEDSRRWGFVPESLILGKAFFIWMSWDSTSKDIRWHRIGKVIKD
ncbi:MAG: signal peptidase I [Proteobacteria bacterium]|nr:signal peptidase I [Pseudomonadota bacterium]